MAILLLMTTGLSAQGPLSEAVAELPVSALPFRPSNADTHETYGCAGVGHTEQTRWKIYSNFLCTDVYSSDFEETSPIAIKKFTVENKVLVLVDYSSVSEHSTSVLYLTDETGEVLDRLEVEVWCTPFPAMNYAISATGVVTTYRLVPTAGDPYFWTFNSFVGKRVDKTYSIENGKFVLKSTKEYLEQTYTREMLDKEPRRYFIWNGHEFTRAPISRF